MLIPKNYKDPCIDEERDKYDDPVFSRDAVLELLELNKLHAHVSDFISFYKDEKKKNAMNIRFKAMVKSGQIIFMHNKVYHLDFWPHYPGTIVKKGHDYFVKFDNEPNKLWHLYRRLPNLTFEGDYSYFVKIPNSDQAAFYELIKGSDVYVEGTIKDPNDFDIPSHTQYPMVVNFGPYLNQVISIRAPKGLILNQHDSALCKLDRDDSSPYVVADWIQNGYPKGLTQFISLYDLPWVWSEDVSDEAQKFRNLTVRKAKNRIDLTELNFVTIDGASAKDFDDAVYAEKKDDGSYNLFVAIADVSHYVKRNSVIDKEAAKRGVSVYFPRFVIPMLPEILSNELCSLKPDVNRYALVCQMEVKSDGTFENYKFYKAVIKSKARLTYDQVAKNKVPKNLELAIEQLWKVYKILADARHKTGYVSFSQYNVEFEFTKSEKISFIGRVPSNDAHRMIEEMMLAANRCAANFIHKHGPQGLYRIHDEPLDEKVQLLNKMLESLNIKIESPYTLEKIAAASASLQKEHPRLTSMISRIMQRAIYTVDPNRHYGLNFDLYTHFTSPIRRYPDLIVHRMIYGILDNQKIDPNQYIDELESANILERRAEEAERSYHAYLKINFAEQLVGKNLRGVVVGVMDFGIFIELDDYPIEGMVHISKISNDYWTVSGGRASSFNNEICLGDKVTVIVDDLDYVYSRINFRFVSFGKKKQKKANN